MANKVELKTLVEKMNLKNLTPDVDLSDKDVEIPDINRPALQLTGFFEHFDSERVQIFSSCRADSRNIVQHRMHLPLAAQLSVKCNCKTVRFVLYPGNQPETFRVAVNRKFGIIKIQSSRSVLDDIPGVGPARRKDLMRCFENIDAIRNATVEELKELPSMNEKSAQEVYNFCLSFFIHAYYPRSNVSLHIRLLSKI